MTKSEQVRFVKQLTNTMAETLIGDIRNGKVPDTFDGHELRVMVMQLALDHATISNLVQNPKSQRARDYRNWKAVS
jgi:hypothetical protein